MDTFFRVLEIAFVPLMVAIIAVWRRENKDQHDHNAGLSLHLSKQVEGIDRKLDRLDVRHDRIEVWQVEHESTHLIDRANSRSDL